MPNSPPIVGQASHTCVTARKVAPARVQRPHDQFDAIAAEVYEPSHVLDLARRAVFGRAPADGETEPPQCIKGRFKITRVTHLQTDRLQGAITCDEGKRVIPKIRAEGRELLVPVDRLKAQNALSEIRRAAEVVRDKTHVAQLFEVNHSSSPPARKRHSNWLSSPPFTLAG